MFRLEALGGLRLIDAGGAPTMTQRRRLALLALVAGAGDRGITRDKLIAYLWPESSTEHARHALEQLLYAIRRQGDQNLVLGPDPLRLNPTTLRTDVADFAEAMARGAWAEAVALYRGPFLDGFYLGDAPEFERWCEQERVRLAAEHSRALRKLAAEAEAQGRHTTEIDVRRRLADADPLGERAAEGLVRALAGAGDWAGALNYARDFESRLRRELPSAPASDLVALVGRIRAEARPGTPSPATAPPDERYAVERELARGSVATVYLARDRKHDRPVVLKVLRPEIATATDAKRFIREIGILAHLHHPHILQLYDSGVLGLAPPGAGLYYVMPYVSGGSLREWLKREGRLPMETAVRLAREVADALEYAHLHGVVHRDVRPENVLLESGHAMVGDFGIARLLETAGGEQVSAAGILLGVPAYMSPEQATASQELDGRSDIYSLGCVLYEMLAGEPPFGGATRSAVLARQISDSVPPLRTLCPGLPSKLEGAILRALAKRPGDRFRTAAEFAREL